MGFIFLILLSWGCMSKFNLTQWFLILWWRNLKSSLQLKTRLIFEFLLRKILGTVKHVQVNCMRLTSSMCPIQLFQANFQLHCRPILILDAKKNTLKGTDWNVFCAHFTMDRDSHHQFDAATLLKIIWIKITFFKRRVSIILWSFSS